MSRAADPGAPSRGTVLGAQGMFAAGLGFAAGMDAVVKLSLGAVSLPELLLWRGFGAAALIGLVLLLTGRFRRLWPASWPIVLGRGLAVAASTWLFFWALGGLSLAVAYVVTFTMPLVLTGLAVLVLGERVRPRVWLLILLAFGGAVLAASPIEGTGDALHLGAAFVATALYAVSLILARLSRFSESTEATTIWTLIVVGLVALIAGVVLQAPIGPDRDTLPALAGIAGLAALSQYAVTWAFRSAPASALAATEYSTLLWGVVLDAAIWRVWPTPQLAIGCTIVVACAILAARMAQPR